MIDRTISHYQVAEKLGGSEGEPVPGAVSSGGGEMAPDNARSLPQSDLPPAAVKRAPLGLGNPGAIHMSV